MGSCQAAEDITTPEGTVWYTNGQLIETLTTTGGEVESIELPLGSYKIKEIQAPNGFILDTAFHDVTLTYQGQTIDVFPVLKHIENVRPNPKVETDLKNRDLVYEEAAEIIFSFRAKTAQAKTRALKMAGIGILFMVLSLLLQNLMGAFVIAPAAVMIGGIYGGLFQLIDLAYGRAVLKAAEQGYPDIYIKSNSDIARLLGK